MDLNRPCKRCKSIVQVMGRMSREENSVAKQENCLFLMLICPLQTAHCMKIQTCVGRTVIISGSMVKIYLYTDSYATVMVRGELWLRELRHLAPTTIPWRFEGLIQIFAIRSSHEIAFCLSWCISCQIHTNTHHSIRLGTVRLSQPEIRRHQVVGESATGETAPVQHPTRPKTRFFTPPYMLPILVTLLSLQLAHGWWTMDSSSCFSSLLNDSVTGEKIIWLCHGE